MGKVIHACSNDSTSQAASVTRYHLLIGNAGVQAESTEANVTTVLRTAGTFSLLLINVLTNDRAQSTFRVRKGTADVNQVVTITASTTGKFEDTSNTDAVSAGDDFHNSLVTGAGGTVFTFGVYSIIFEASSGTVHKIGHSGGATSFDNSTGYAGTLSNISTNSNGEIYPRFGVVCSNFCTYLSANARTTNTSLINVVNNVNGNCVITVTASTTGTFEDTSNTDTLTSAGRFVTKKQNGGGSGSQTYEHVSIDVTDDDAEDKFTCTIALGGGVTLSPSTTYYPAIGGVLTTNATEANAKTESNLAVVGSRLQGVVSSNTISADSSLRSRIDTGSGSANGNQLVTITASTTGRFEDASNSDTIAATDSINYSLATGGSGTNLVLRIIIQTFDSTVVAGSGVTQANLDRIPFRGVMRGVRR